MTPAPSSLTTVSVSGVTLKYGRTLALNDVSFAFGDGVTGLLGPNGSSPVDRSQNRRSDRV